MKGVVKWVLLGVLGAVLIFVVISEVIVSSNTTHLKLPLIIGMVGIAAGILFDVFDPLIVFFKKIK